MKALISKGLRPGRSEFGLAVFKDSLRDEQEELFVVMVCDGLPFGLAFRRAGFTSKHKNAAYDLFQLPRLQARAKAILEARRTSNVVSLPEVTDMLKRVFAGAHSEGEYSAAHNAAFSLARLYGHVSDKSTVEIIRRPSRDPDAPSEQALMSWVETLPGLEGPGPSGPAFSEAFGGPPPAAPADLLGPVPESPNDINGLHEMNQGPSLEGSGPQSEFSNDFKWLPGPGPLAAGRPENGAPAKRVTMTPHRRGPSPPLEKGAPVQTQQVPVPTGGFPPIEDLF